jgi:hypothetical protein
MKAAELLGWYEEIRANKPAQWFSFPSLTEAAAAWQTSVGSALAAAFPPGHRVLVEWERAIAPARLRSGGPAVFMEGEQVRWNAMSGVFASAYEQLRMGRIEGLVDRIRAEAEDDVLDQAATLLDGNFLAAAAVLAGGALETHLRRLCAKNSLTVSGHGTIDKYNTAIAQARNSGVTIYEKPEQSQVTGWGQLRNEAAHDPAGFSSARTKPEVQLMIDGIRQFIVRWR